MEKKYILALDQGTTSSRAILFDKESHIIQVAQKEFAQIYPKAGWVEHDPMEIWGTQSGVAREVLERAGINPIELAAIGIANQRETVVVWDKFTGKPIYNAIVWQCRRTAELCETLKQMGLEDYIKENTGLVLDAYFSATKLMWLLDQVEGARERAERGELLFGTIDTWLIWHLTKGKVHATDYSNASRTMLYNINNLCWDEYICNALDIPLCMLPQVKNSSEIYGYTHEQSFGGALIPIAGVAGDQQAALFGQACFSEGMVKNTYGTGCFLLMNTGKEKINSANGLITTIAWGLHGEVTYALEGSVFIGGAVIQWLRDELKLINEPGDSEYYASKVEDNGGVYIVPAFVGLGAPHWDMYARGAIYGLTRGSNKNHLIRGALESIAYQTRDIIDAMTEDSSLSLKVLKVDGGGTGNNLLMQFQADILGKEVHRPAVTETTALGVAYLAGLAVGLWASEDEVIRAWKIDQVFRKEMSEEKREHLYRGWKKAVSRSMGWQEK